MGKLRLKEVETVFKVPAFLYRDILSTQEDGDTCEIP